mmetsp:Transcript_7366/g.16268  ORF Transcript_7366/g.16268 Transcript_7366/m.16268 type:complete len:234 (-) Transcript_7366:228-929(-)|eukprot:CAMPEP_0206422044 /NCGR_PEP_ID=MMETSP0324_2-20121206/1831_1 /ASSEMBLY_ACC=CAM_ASM_000836 /TAXON_ID=2866 /ORGANISM="Crypthecodinium cohnii, Strain Seligo" /LENGTH=233 /DNA_ID=CAMNT_0053886299 /DNA_START=56 /DNA_END=757 /DNA_ORIENTATION=-
MPPKKNAPAASSSLSSAALRRCREELWAPLGFHLLAEKEPLAPDPDPRGAAYDSCLLDLAGAAVEYRTAKITPTKTGAFVTCWKRPGGRKGAIVPLSHDNSWAALVVAVDEGPSKFGHFVFLPSELESQGILKDSKSKGKLSFRVYAPWVEPESQQAASSQAWQKRCFVSSPASEEEQAWLTETLVAAGCRRRGGRAGGPEPQSQPSTKKRPACSHDQEKDLPTARRARVAVE